MSSTKRKKIFMAVGGLLALVTIYFTFQHMLYVSTENAHVDAMTVMLAPKVGGYIVKVGIEEGQSVKKDEVLVELDDRDYQHTLTQIKGELTSLAASRTEAEKNFVRLNSLFKTGAISQQQFESASSAFSNFKAKYDSMEAQVEQAKLNLENTKIRAPQDGVIAKKSAELGQLAAPGVPLVGFVGSGDRWVTANFKETEIDSIHVGSKALIEVDAIPSKDFSGEVIGISSATGATFSLLPPDNATGNFTKVVQRVPVKIKLFQLNEGDVTLLRAGLSAVVRIRK